MRPRRLPNRLSRQELGHHGLNVQHGRHVDGIQFSNEYPSAFSACQSTDRATNAIGSILPALSKYAHWRPLRVVSWMPGSRGDLCVGDLVKEVNDFNLGEFCKAL